MKLITVIGARPQFIKHSPVQRELSLIEGLSHCVIHTGQHYDADMSDVFFQELGIDAPTFNIAIGSGSHGLQTGKMLVAIEEIFLKERPNWVLVYGDTNSTLAGALAAAKMNIPVLHVEAGLRSYDMTMPEEINRRMTDHVSSILFTPTQQAVENLKVEGITGDNVELVGDVMLDAFRLFLPIAGFANTRISQEYVLCTVHRAENTDDRERLSIITDALRRIAEVIPVVIPLHPRTRQRLLDFQLLSTWDRSFNLVGPASYLTMLKLESEAKVIITDSGGVQKEAFFANRNCITLRSTTEWTELLSLGVNRLSPPVDPKKVFEDTLDMLNQPFPESVDLYGDGEASRKIANRLVSLMGV